ncbi:MAG: nickel transporter, partial [Betaproteobacteria bacterium]|nr:nickel transporter [Betaproteobacteria bacterium]
LARWSGVLFSLGHGVIVTLVAALAAIFSREWAPPPWLEYFGTWVSISFLLVLGCLNLRAAMETSAQHGVVMGLRGRWLRRFTATSHPLLIAAVGAAFALSFDTVSQAALFSLTAANLAGWTFATLLGVIFMSGMMTADGLAGWWLGGLIRKADARARLLARAMSFVVGAMSIGIAGLGFARWLHPESVAAIDRFAWLMGAAMAIAVPTALAWLLRRNAGRPGQTA